MIRAEHVKEDMKVLDKAIADDTATLGNVVKAITLVIKICQMLEVIRLAL